MGHPDMPEAALFLQGRNYRWIFTTRYYSCPPWPHLLVAAMERWGKAPARYPQRRLPVPELDQINPQTGMPWLWEAGGRELCVRYSLSQSTLGYTERRAIG
jgi:hypothetical protein